MPDERAPRPEETPGPAAAGEPIVEPTPEPERKRDAGRSTSSNGRADRAARPPRATTGPKLQKDLHDFFSSISLGVMFLGDEHCARVLATQAEPLAQAYYNLAQKNARVKALLEAMVAGSAWGEVLMVTAATVIPIAAHHGAIPAPTAALFGFVPPSPEGAEHEQQQRRRRPEHPAG